MFKFSYSKLRKNITTLVNKAYILYQTVVLNFLLKFIIPCCKTFPLCHHFTDNSLVKSTVPRIFASR